MHKPQNSSQDWMKWIILMVASTLFIAGVIVRFFQPTSNITDLTNAFLIVSGLVFGSNVANLFKKK